MKTLKSIKVLLICITSLSLLSGVIDKVFPSLFSFPNLSSILCLNANSLASYKIWQFVSHMFFYPAPSGIHIFYLINLFFGMTILQRMGQIISLNRGERSFLSYFFFCGLVGGIAAFFTLLHSGSMGYFAGPTSALYCLIIATIFIFPKLDFMLFFSSPVKGKVVVPALIGVILLMDLSVGNYTSFFATSSASLAGYLYILFFWNLKSPYASLSKFENGVIHISNGRFSSMIKNEKLEKYTKNKRIFDIHTGKAVITDEMFVNACLDKISKEGKSSLTYYERYKLYRYSKRTLKKQNKDYSAYHDFRDK